MAIEGGATSDAVARALGHTSFEMTAKHYASGDSVVNARLARASQVLAPKPGSPAQTAAETVSELLSQLTPEQIAELQRRLVG